jgi:hypothetical protein
VWPEGLDKLKFIHLIRSPSINMGLQKLELEFTGELKYMAKTHHSVCHRSSIT